MADLRHLSVVDGASLHLESPEMPMHVGSLALFVLPPGGPEAWFEAVKAHVASRLDRSRLLWAFYVIEGLAEGRVGFYSKVHHSAVDGQAAVAMANSIFDLTPEPPPSRAGRGRPWQRWLRPRPQPRQHGQPARSGPQSAAVHFTRRLAVSLLKFKVDHPGPVPQG